MSKITRRDFLGFSALGALATFLTAPAKEGAPNTPFNPPRTWPRLFADDAELAAVRARLASLPPEFTREIARADERISAEPDSPSPAFDPNGRLDAYRIFFAAWLALLARVTNDERYARAARRHLPAIAELENATVDLAAGAKNGDLMMGHWLLAVSLYHDWMHDRLSSEDLTGLRRALTVQARAVHNHFAQERTWAFEQNHVFILAGGLGFAGFALLGSEPEAPAWIDRARTFMQRSGQALCADGFYYEGVSYFGYAFHWHVLFAIVLKRMTGEDWLGSPPFLRIGEYVLHHTTPGGKFCFDYADWGPRQGQPGYDQPWHSVPTRWTLWALLGLRHQRGSSPALDAALRLHLGRDYNLERIGIFHLLWACPDVLRAEQNAITALPPHYHFADHGIAVWRENWRDADATALWLKCGPPEGHRATELRRQWPDWKPNAGHAHPDAGHFLLWSRGHFLAGDTGYTGVKRTLDHNSLLVDGDGQFRDGRYHAFDAVDFQTLDALRFRQLELDEQQVVASCSLTAAYDSRHALRELERRVLFRHGRLLLIQDRWSRRRAGQLTWLWHADEQPTRLDDRRWLIRAGEASIVLIVVSEFADARAEPAIVPAYTGTPDVAPDWRQRGWRLRVLGPRATEGEIVVAGVLNPARPEDADAARDREQIRFSPSALRPD